MSVDVCQWMCVSGCVSEWMCLSGCVLVDVC